MNHTPLRQPASRRRHARHGAAAGAALLFAAGCASTGSGEAMPERVIAVTARNQIIEFVAGRPEHILARRSLSGIQDGERVIVPAFTAVPTASAVAALGATPVPVDVEAHTANLDPRLVEAETAPTGTFHFSNAGPTTWAGFAREIFAQSAARGGASAEVKGIPSSDYPTPARRPANSLLSHAAIGAAYGIEPRPWQDALSDILDELIGATKA